VVFQRADVLPGHRAEPAGTDNWQTGSSLGQLAEPQGRDADGSYARTMNLNMQNADIRTILRAIADFSGRNIIASPEVKGTVTVALSDVPWREALSVILRANAFGFVEEDGIIRVDTAERLRTEELAEKAAAQRSKELEPLVTRIVPIDYANATEVKSSVQKMLSQRGSVEVDPRTNSLIVTDVPAMVGELQRLARELDTRTPQVHIDALMVDIDSNQGRELGIKWGALNAAPSKLSLAGDAVVDRQITESAGTLRVGTVLNWTELQLELQSLERRNLANIISNPRITTTDNREASILVGQKIPLITQDVAGNPVTRLETIGIRLTVTPHINSDKQITLDVHPEVSDLSSQATVQGGVIINTSEADTRVLVNNRETAVIGGLIRNVSNDFEAGVPVLKDLPFLGALFRTKSTTTSQRELVVFLTPTIVGEDGTAPDTYESGLREDVQDLLQRNRAGVMR
jgi:type IV pilus assembly protein PilQ